MQRGEVARGWLWGPVALGVSTEHYADSPTGTRRMVWFDKGRIDINDPNGDASSLWYATGAQLVTELVAGALQFGEGEWVRRGAPAIPVSGDPNQASAVTYATLTDHATLPNAVRGSDDDRTAEDRTGQPVTARLRASGEVEPGGVSSYNISIGRYDAVIGHNIAAPFADWEAQQPYPELYLLGRPLTEPYWIDTVVGGDAKRVLIQAFERRLLSYTPDNPDGWQVESANVGQHYRAWRGLGQTAAGTLAALAAFEPFAEELLAAATTNAVDPTLLIAIAQIASGADPSARHGLALLAGESSRIDAVNDPLANANAAARRLAEMTEAGDDRATLIAFHGGERRDASAFADAVLAKRDEIAARYAAPIAPVATTQTMTALAISSATPYPAAVSRDWWERSLAWYGTWGGALTDAQPDPNGQYCTLADYAPGDRLRLVANGATLDCTIGADARLTGERASLGLDRASFDALGLSGNNSVTIYHLGTGETGGTGALVSAGGAAYYSASFDRAWWDWAIGFHAGNGNAVADWATDPNGFYCVHPDYRPGQRLRLVANGVTLDCTIGDSVQTYDQPAWRSKWAIELSWDTFVALGLDGSNRVEVYEVR